MSRGLARGRGCDQPQHGLRLLLWWRKRLNHDAMMCMGAQDQELTTRTSACMAQARRTGAATATSMQELTRTAETAERTTQPLFTSFSFLQVKSSYLLDYWNNTYSCTTAMDSRHNRQPRHQRGKKAGQQPARVQLNRTTKQHEATPPSRITKTHGQHGARHQRRATCAQSACTKEHKTRRAHPKLPAAEIRAIIWAAPRRPDTRRTQAQRPTTGEKKGNTGAHSDTGQHETCRRRPMQSSSRFLPNRSPMPNDPVAVRGHTKSQVAHSKA